jgi:predicted ester cyclase
VTMSTDTRPAVDTLAHLAGRFVREHNQPEYLASHEALLAPDAVVHEYLPGLPDSLDRAGYAGFIAMFRSALPDVANTVEDVVVANDRAVVRWIGGGTHTGAPLLGRPATGRRVQAHGVYVLRFAGARIAEVWNHWDNLNVLGQLGAPGEAEKEVVRRFFAANDQQRLDLMPTLVAEDLVMHSSVPVPAAGREGLLQLLHGLRAAFPTQRTEIHRLIAEGDVVVALHTHHVTHGGPFMGRQPTGMEVAVAGLEAFRFADGKIAEFWHQDDLFSLVGALDRRAGPA